MPSRSDGGCPFPADPDAAAWDIPALWLPYVDAGITVLVAAPGNFDVRALPDALSARARASAASADGQHLVLAAETGVLRLHIVGQEAQRRPAALIPLDGGEDLRIGELRRFLRYAANRPVPTLPRALLLSRYRTWRLADVLRALAGNRAGASSRDIGMVIDPSVRFMTLREWEDSAQRSRVARLLGTARNMTDGSGYLSLLRPGRRRMPDRLSA